MARQRKFNHMMQVNLRQIDRAILGYYAAKYQHDRARIARSMIRRYAEVDAAFDEQEFKRYVQRDLLPEAKGDAEHEEEIKRQLAAFLENRQRARKR